MNRLAQLLISLVASILLVGACGGVASAHVLKSDSGTSAVLHIPPEDNPQAAQPTHLDFDFSNNQGSFSLAKCICQLTITQNGQTIQNSNLQPLMGGQASDATAVVTFPTIGIYDVILKGSATDNSFRPFSLDYVERVAVSAKGSAPTTMQRSGRTVLLISSASFILLVMLAITFINTTRRKL